MKTSLSNALKLLVSYIVIMLVGTFLGAVLYTIYSLCTTIVAGELISFFDPALFMKGIFVCAPVIMAASGMLMIFYLIRHSSGSWLPILFYIIIYLSTWIFLMPLSFSVEHVFLERHKAVTLATPNVSSGYFRRSGPYISYFSKVDDTNYVSGLCIDANGASKEVYTFSDMILVQGDEIFVDSLVQENMGMPGFVADMFIYGSGLLQIGRVEHRHGFFHWLCFATMGLAIAAIAGLRHVSKWRLVNVVLMFYSMFLILFLNIYSYFESFLTPLVVYMNGILEKVIRVENPFLLTSNLLLAFIFALTGLLIDINRKRNYGAA